jgi:hypothetical protein
MDVNRLVDDNNKEGIVTAVFDAVEAFQGWSDLNKDVLLNDWKLVGPEDRHIGRRAAPVRSGLATTLIQVELEYTRWSTAAGINVEAVTELVNHVLATYDTAGHHACFTFEFGFDESCVIELVTNAISEELSTCTVAQAELCRDRAIVQATRLVIGIKGCGLLGTIENDKRLLVCADPAAEAVAEEEALAIATEAVEKALTIIVDQYNAQQAAVLDALRLINATAAEREADREIRFDAEVGQVLKQLQTVVLSKSLKVLLDEAASNTDGAQQALAGFESALAAADCESAGSYLSDGGEDLIGAGVDQAAVDAARAKAEACQALLIDVEEGAFQVRLQTARQDEIEAAHARAIAAENAAAAAAAAAGAAADIAAIDDLLADLDVRLETAAGAVQAAEEEVAKAGCGASDTSTICEALIVNVNSAKAKAAKITEDMRLAAEAKAAADAKSAKAAEETSFNTLIGAIAGGVVFILVIIGIVAYVVVNKKKAAADKKSADSKIVAFANPMSVIVLFF